MTSLGLDAWWDEPAYTSCNTFHLRGLFIFDKLTQHDAARFAEVPQRRGEDMAAEIARGLVREQQRKALRRPDWRPAGVEVEW